MRIDTRSAVNADKPYLVWLEEACMRAYAVALWGAWPPDLAARGSVAGCRIILADGHEAGCVTTERAADHVRLDELFVAPMFQRQGIGSLMLLDVVERARGLGLPVRLSVLTTNPAVTFYRGHGFHVSERTPERVYMTTELSADDDRHDAGPPALPQ